MLEILLNNGTTVLPLSCASTIVTYVKVIPTNPHGPQPMHHACVATCKYMMRHMARRASHTRHGPCIIDNTYIKATALRESVWISTVPGPVAAVLHGPSAHRTRPPQLEFHTDLQGVTVSMRMSFYVYCGRAHVKASG